MGTAKSHRPERPQRRGRDLRDPGEAFELLLAANPLPMWVYDLETLRFLEVNEAAVAHYGYTRAEFLAMSITDIRPEEDGPRLRQALASRHEALQHSGTWRHRRADGTLLEVEVTSHLVGWGGRRAALVVAHDVTENHRLQAAFARRSLYDEATGLASAALFLDRTTAALTRGRASHVGVVVAGLGALDTVASTLGDTAADILVAESARRLRSCCGAGETPARLGGGRFAVLCESVDDHRALHVAGAVIGALSEAVAVPGTGALRSSPAVGVALADHANADATSLVREATAAMRHAAERGGGVVVANAELRRAILEAFSTEQALPGAIAGGQLRLFYQPVVDLHGDGVLACEALVRWQRPGIGLVAPERFVPLAERSGLIVELGRWVIERAIGEAAAWPITGRRPTVVVNLSAHQLRDDRLVERITDACDAAGLSPAALGVELTESAFVAADDYGAYRHLAALRELGVKVAIDDFGTGYSALLYLKHLPVDILKIDRGFVAGIGVDRADTLLVEAIVHVAHGLGLRVVAEGVETEPQLEAVRALGCDAGQGHLFAAPVPSSKLRVAVEDAARSVS